MLGLVNDAHAAAADLTHNAIIAQAPGQGRCRLAAGRGKTDQLQGRQHLAQDVGDRRMAAGIILDLRPLAKVQALQELIDHLGNERLDRQAVRRKGCRSWRQLRQARVGQQLVQPEQGAAVALAGGGGVDVQEPGHFIERQSFEGAHQKDLAVVIGHLGNRLADLGGQFPARKCLLAVELASSLPASSSDDRSDRATSRSTVRRAARTW